jgi:hypothetical protein
VSVDEIEKGWAHSGRQPRIAIIGAGFSGIASIIKLREAGYTDLTCFERADRLGGTWRDNTYPGLSCDVPSHWYSYSFEMNPDWTHRFSYGPEIWAYQEKVAQKYQVKDVIQFSNGVIDLTFLGPQWQIRSEKGGDENFDFVIAATGVLVNPSYPDIPGGGHHRHRFHRLADRGCHCRSGGSSGCLSANSALDRSAAAKTLLEGLAADPEAGAGPAALHPPTDSQAHGVDLWRSHHGQ